MLKNKKIMLLSIVKCHNNQYKITYCFPNFHYNQFYRGVLYFSYLINDNSLFNKFKKYGKWVKASLNEEGEILKIF